ncbi:hypothetical protein M885DRAFT_609984, partial [Pelagophyceae sp. CCMP2097]
MGPGFEGPSCYTNVLVKSPLPERGIVSSNPKRVERLLSSAQSDGSLSNVMPHTDAGWGVIVHTAKYRDTSIFIAAVPMGSAGAGVAFFEMFAAGARAIVRYGSNDRKTTAENLRDVLVVDVIDNVIGLTSDSCAGHRADGATTISASPTLVAALEECAKKSRCPVKRMVCHNVEDYHAFNFPKFFANAAEIDARVYALEA